jgi:hypothetical protein
MTAFAENPRQWATELYEDFHDATGLKTSHASDNVAPYLYGVRQLSQRRFPYDIAENCDNARTVMNGYQRLLEVEDGKYWTDARFAALTIFAIDRTHEE